MKLASTAKYPRKCHEHAYEILNFLAVFYLYLQKPCICLKDKCYIFFCLSILKLLILNNMWALKAHFIEIIYV